MTTLPCRWAVGVRATSGCQSRSLLGRIDAVFAVIEPAAKALLDPEVDALIEQRAQARKDKNWKRSDEIRDQLKALGVAIEDSKDGTTWKWA